jgi:hypothetical protein
MDGAPSFFGAGKKRKARSVNFGSFWIGLLLGPGAGAFCLGDGLHLVALWGGRKL